MLSGYNLSKPGTKDSHVLFVDDLKIQLLLDTVQIFTNDIKME